MKTKFTREYIFSERGCYSEENVNDIRCINNKSITIKQLFRDLPIKDFTWFLVQKCELTISEKRRLALHCAKQVLPIYEKKYPKDKRVRECIEYTELYLNGNGDIDILREKRQNAAAAADAAYTASSYADAAADAAYAAAHAAAYAADAYTASSYADANAAAAAAAYAAYAAAYAAYAAYAANAAAAAADAYTATVYTADAAANAAAAADADIVAYEISILKFVESIK